MVEIFFLNIKVYHHILISNWLFLHSNIGIFSFEFYFSYWWPQLAGIQEQKSI